MKKSILTALIIVAAAGLYSGVQAGQPLILEPLSTTVLSSSPSTYNATTVSGEVKSPIGGGVYEATFTPASALEYGENMVPQNAAAKGEPVPEKRQPRIRIQTKQRSQGNSYWNPGGKGTKSFF